ncbi:Hsc70-interacting protein [Anthophora plagiata]
MRSQCILDRRVSRHYDLRFGQVPECIREARRIEEHKRKQERKIQAKLEKERQERLKKAREAAKAYRENTRTSQTDANADADFYKFINDPEVVKAFEDPDIVNVFNEIVANPSNILKYQSNPKVMMFMNKLANKFNKCKNSDLSGAAAAAAAAAAFSAASGGSAEAKAGAGTEAKARAGTEGKAEAKAEAKIDTGADAKSATPQAKPEDVGLD